MDQTEQCIRESSAAPGEYADVFRRAKAAKKLSPAQADAVAKFAGVTLGHVSNVLLYDNALRYVPVRVKQSLYSAIKGGHLRVIRTDAGYTLEKV